MNREQTIANVVFARSFAMLAPADDVSSRQLDLDTFVSVLEALPSYAEIDLTFIDGGDQRLFHLMARDIPGPGRRFTNLTHGTEWLGIRDVIDPYGADFVVATKHGEEQPMLLTEL